MINTPNSPTLLPNLFITKNITEIAFKEEWLNSNLVVYAEGLGKVRDLIGLLPLIKRLNLKFFLDGAKKENYEAVQILSSLGIYTGIVINEKADWEKLTDLMYYALCGRVALAPIEPFQYVYEMYRLNVLVDYGVVYANNAEKQKSRRAECRTQKAEGRTEIPLQFIGGVDGEAGQGASLEGSRDSGGEDWQWFFYEPTECAACPGWRICLGKYETLKDKSRCQQFTTEWLNMIETQKINN
jgi:hypothetical protein